MNTRTDIIPGADNPSEQQAYALERYREGASLGQISRELGRSKSTIQGWLKGAQIPRQKGPSPTVKAPNRKLVTKKPPPIDPEKLSAIALGMIQRGTAAVERLWNLAETTRKQIEDPNIETTAEHTQQYIGLLASTAKWSQKVAENAIEAKQAGLADQPIDNASLDSVQTFLETLQTPTTDTYGNPLSPAQQLVAIAQSQVRIRQMVSQAGAQKLLNWIVNAGPDWVPSSKAELEMVTSMLKSLSLNPNDVLKLAQYADQAVQE